MAFDYKKEYKEFYMPKAVPTIAVIPKMNYIAVRGRRPKEITKSGNVNWRNDHGIY